MSKKVTKDYKILYNLTYSHNSYSIQILFQNQLYKLNEFNQKYGEDIICPAHSNMATIRRN